MSENVKSTYSVSALIKSDHIRPSLPFPISLTEMLMRCEVNFSLSPANKSKNFPKYCTGAATTRPKFVPKWW